MYRQSHFQVDDEEEKIENVEDEGSIPFKYSITSYGADYPVDSLVKRLNSGAIHIPDFQRGFVWDKADASRFIESLLLGLPVPGIFFSKEDDSQKLLVIDGQQRLRSLQYFYKEVFADKSVFSLVEVQKQFVGLTYSGLSEEDRRRIDDSIIHATVVRQDEPSKDNSSIYHIFERLNTGGLQLQPQEIRACIYHGEFNKLLRSINQNHDWRLVFGKVSPRMRDQELILRFLALHLFSEPYSKPMKNYLNLYMANNRNLQIHGDEIIRQSFIPTIDLARRAFGKRAFRPRGDINAAVFDSVMIALARRLTEGKINDVGVLAEKYQALLSDMEYSTFANTATADEENVSKRIEIATRFFADVP